ncbi:MAG: hypothetical protein RBR77_13980, partial [Thauera sp.]|nr:hypothetical protein [Thauera sp.]
VPMIETHSETWLAVAAKLAAMRAGAVDAVLARSATEQDTFFYRGIVAAVDEVMRLADVPSDAVEVAPAAAY